MTQTVRRHLRQEREYGESARRQSGVALVSARDNAVLARQLVIDNTAAGTKGIYVDSSGSHQGEHWYWGPYAGLSRAVDSSHGGFDVFDRACPGGDLLYLMRDLPNGLVAVPLNDMEHAAHSLEDIVSTGLEAHVLLVLTAPGGLVAMGYASAADAIEDVSRLSGRPIAPGPPERSVAASGIITNTLIQLAKPGGESGETGLLAGYSLHRNRRVIDVDTPLADILAEISEAPGLVASFARRSYIFGGAGGLATPAVVPLLYASPVSVRVYDRDLQIEAHNLSRQYWLVDGADSGRPKAEIFVETLRNITPESTFEAFVADIQGPDDIDLREADVPLALPDNDKLRHVFDRARRQMGLPLATAGTSIDGGTVVISPPAGPCLKCLGIPDGDDGVGGGNSCARADGSIITTNAVTAGLLMGELREHLAGRKACNLRFESRGRGNRIARMLTGPPCPHRSRRRARR